MKRLILIFVVFTLVLTACGYKDRKSVESFAGESVATISNSSQSNDFATEITDDGEDQIGTADPAATSTYQVPQTLIAPNVSQEPDPSNPPVYAASQSPYPISNDPTKTPTSPSPSNTAVPSATATFTPSPTFTPTPIPLEWAGEWNIWFQNTTGKYVHSIMTLTVIGDKVFGNATIDGAAYTFEGGIYTNNTVSGEWKTTNRTVRFWWEPEDTNVFLGSWAERFGFCGNKLEAVQPEPCMITPTF